MRKRIVVTQRDIDADHERGDHWSPGTFCPVERAFARAGFVGTTGFSSHSTYNPDRVIQLPAAARKFIHARRWRAPIKPFQFTVEIADNG